MVLCYCCVSHGGPGRNLVPYSLHYYNCVLEDIGYAYINDNYDYGDFIYYIKVIQKFIKKYNLKNKQ